MVEDFRGVERAFYKQEPYPEFADEARPPTKGPVAPFINRPALPYLASLLPFDSPEASPRSTSCWWSLGLWALLDALRVKGYSTEAQFLGGAALRDRAAGPGVRAHRCTSTAAPSACLMIGYWLIVRRWWPAVVVFLPLSYTAQGGADPPGPGGRHAVAGSGRSFRSAGVPRLRGAPRLGRRLVGHRACRAAMAPDPVLLLQRRAQAQHLPLQPRQRQVHAVLRRRDGPRGGPGAVADLAHGAATSRVAVAPRRTASPGCGRASPLVAAANLYSSSRPTSRCAPVGSSGPSPSPSAAAGPTVQRWLTGSARWTGSGPGPPSADLEARVADLHRRSGPPPRSPPASVRPSPARSASFQRTSTSPTNAALAPVSDTIAPWACRARAITVACGPSRDRSVPARSRSQVPSREPSGSVERPSEPRAGHTAAQRSWAGPW